MADVFFVTFWHLWLSVSKCEVNVDVIEVNRRQLRPWSTFSVPSTTCWISIGNRCLSDYCTWSWLQRQRWSDDHDSCVNHVLKKHTRKKLSSWFAFWRNFRKLRTLWFCFLQVPHLYRLSDARTLTGSGPVDGWFKTLNQIMRCPFQEFQYEWVVNICKYDIVNIGNVLEEFRPV